MSGVRVLVGTRKGEFILTADGKRERWNVSGPHFAGWEIYHMKGSPADPNRLYASQSSGWFGQVIQRSCDGGKTWETPGGGMTKTADGMPAGESNKFVYDTSPDTGKPLTTHQFYDGTQHPWEFKRVWHLEPSLPDPTAEIGHCVHRIALHRSRPGVLFMQKHWDVMRSDDAGDSWHEISGNLPTDFGFVIDVHAHEPETVYVIPIKSDSEHYVPDGKLRVYRSRKGGNEWEALAKGLPQQDCYVNVLRDAMAVDSLDKCGVYFGTSGGQVYMSADAGDNWTPIVRDLPAVLSVEVQTLR